MRVVSGQLLGAFLGALVFSIASSLPAAARAGGDAAGRESICRALFLPPPPPDSLADAAKVKGEEKNGVGGTAVLVDPADRRSFETAFQSLGKRAKATFVAEGSPFRATLTDTQLAELARVLPAGRALPLDVTVDVIAGAFDYDAEQAGPHLFLLHKRYTDENDIPCVSYAEIIHSLKEIYFELQPYSEYRLDSGLHSPQELFYESLTASQKDQAAQGLAWADLTPDQQTLGLAAVGMNCRNTGYLDIHGTITRLMELKKPQSRFGYLGEDKKATRGYLLDADDADGSEYHPLVKRSGHHAGGAAGEAATPRDAQAAPNLPDDGLPGTVTIGAVVGRLNAAEVGNGDGSRAAEHFGVEAAIAEKPVSIYGAEYSDPLPILHGIAAIYGLELSQPRVGEFYLTMPTGRRPYSSKSFAAELRRLVPAPLLRHYGGLPAIPPANFVGLVSRPVEKTRGKTSSGVARNGEYELVAEAVRGPSPPFIGAIRRFLALAAPLVPTPESPPVALTDIGPEAVRLLALSLFTEYCREAIRDTILKPIPECLVNPERMVVQSNVATGAGFSVQSQFGYRDRFGHFQCEAKLSY